jgi:hypothetical protein
VVILAATASRSPQVSTVYLLVLLDKEHTERQVSKPWEQYASRIAEHFGTP